MNTYDPNKAIEDQAADAMQSAVAICKAAGWSAQAIASLAASFCEMVEPAIAQDEP